MKTANIASIPPASYTISMTPAFSMARQPALLVDTVLKLPELLAEQGFRAAAIVTGGRSVRGRSEWPILMDEILKRDIQLIDFTLRGEPSPGAVDHYHKELSAELPDCDVVVAIGGGSVIDGAKALAAVTAMGGADVRCRDYLEGVGTLQPGGETLPLFAVPTTAGTGSEATKNAVLSEVGPQGYKKSLRHDAFIPRLALIDPQLHLGCPPDITRASGLDAITQLIEVYLSVNATPISDALALEGLRLAGRSFDALLNTEDTPEHRLNMSLAAYLSGVGLASVGLGVVHGIASPLGALREIPHGTACGLLLEPSIKVGLTPATPESREGLKAARRRYADAALALLPTTSRDSPDIKIEKLMDKTAEWAAPLPRLTAFGFQTAEIPAIAKKSTGKQAALAYNFDDICAIMESVF